uniref:Uncharacterized protein n=1 Tax=Parascaris equorum TaxID=6256 RepID=A0A914R1P7_PAREQ
MGDTICTVHDALHTHRRNESATFRIVAVVNFAEKINTMGIDDFKKLFHEIQVRGPCPHELTKHAHELNTKKCRYHGS